MFVKMYKCKTYSVKKSVKFWVFLEGGSEVEMCWTSLKCVVLTTILCTLLVYTKLTQCTRLNNVNGYYSVNSSVISLTTFLSTTEREVSNVCMMLSVKNETPAACLLIPQNKILMELLHQTGFSVHSDKPLHSTSDWGFVNPLAFF